MQTKYPINDPTIVATDVVPEVELPHLTLNILGNSLDSDIASISLP